MCTPAGAGVHGSTCTHTSKIILMRSTGRRGAKTVRIWNSRDEADTDEVHTSKAEADIDAP
jgi:hypothetical protein